MAVQNINRSSVEWANFNKFVDFTKQEGVTNNTIARFEWKNAHKNDFSLERSTSDKIHAFKRSEFAKEANNLVRTKFSNAVCKLFGIKDGNVDKLPPDIKKAMVLDDYGKGKPLSARRIKAVSAAIQKWEGSLSEFSLSKNVQDFDLAEIQGSISKMHTSKEEHKRILEQLAGDANRSHGSVGSARLSKDVEAEFQKNPDATFSENRMTQTWMLNGHQVPSTRDANAIENFFNTQFKVGSGDRNGQALLKVLPALCHQGAFALGSHVMTQETKVFGDGNNLFNGLRPVGNETQQANHVVNIVKSQKGSGYDIFVKQRYFGIQGLSDPNAEGRQTKFFDPMNPGTLTVSCTYHLEMESGQPKVSYAKKPVVKTDFPKEISEKKYRSQASKFIMANMDEIVGKYANNDTRDWWNGMTPRDQKNAVQRFLKDYLNTAIEGAQSLAFRPLAFELDAFAAENS